MNDSFAIDYGPISLPDFTGMRVYMYPHIKGEEYPDWGKEWDDVIDTMTHMVPETGFPMYITIDQSFIKAGNHQREPGPHTDGYWVPGLECDTVHTGGFGGDGEPHHPDEAIIIASNVLGTTIYEGQWEGERRVHGDCSQIDLSTMKKKWAEPGRIYAGHTADMIHETIAATRGELRTFVRINVPGWVPSRNDDKC